MTEVPYGWLIRGIHVWGAHLFIGCAVLHFLTVLFSGAYRKPRELTWVSGVVLLFLALSFGFSGYLLPWNELSYYATLVGTQIPGTIPVVGDFVVQLLRGGEQVGGDTITRFFAAHVMILPLTLGCFLSVHLALIQFQGVSLPLGMKEDKVRDHHPFFSEFALGDSCLWLVLLGAIVTLAVLLPAEMGAKADPLKPPPVGIKPEWFFLFMFQTLKKVPELLGVAFFSLAALFFVLVPFLDIWAKKEKRSAVLTAAFVLLIVYAACFELWGLVVPGVQHAGEPFTAETYSLSKSILSLVGLWSVIGFLVFYLRRLVAANTRVRKLYRDKTAEAETHD
jgi:cytochrome b6